MLLKTVVISDLIISYIYKASFTIPRSLYVEKEKYVIGNNGDRFSGNGGDRWSVFREHGLMQVQLSQALYAGGESTEPSPLTHNQQQ